MTFQHIEGFFSKRLSLALLLLLLITAGVYSGALGNGFVWDDHDVIVRYPLNRSLSNLPALFTTSDSISGWPATPFYRPVARASYVIDYHVYGLNPWGYHLENLLLHLANVLLLFCVARSILKETLPSLLAASFFALHPGISEPVFAAFARNTLLALFFVMSAFLAFYRSEGGSRIRWTLLSAAFFFLGLLSKETAIFLLPVLAWYCHGKRIPFKQCVLYLLPLITVFILYALLRINALEGVLPESTSTVLSQRLLQNIYSVPCYLLILLAPVKLTVLHEIPSGVRSLSALLVFSWILITAGVIAIVKYGDRNLKFGLFWGVCALVPVLGLVEIPGGPLAERHLYVPCAGFALAVASLATSGLRRHAAIGSGIVCLFLALFMARTVVRSHDWINDTILFQRAVENNPVSVTAHYNLGNAYLEANNLGLALKEWMVAVKIDPTAQDALYQIGSQLLYAGRYQEAQHYLERAVAVKPAWFYAQSNLAVALDMLNKQDAAIQQYERALGVLPPDRADSIPLIRKRISQLRNNEHNDNNKVLIQKEILN